VGFWSWLTGKPKSVQVADFIWLNQDAKFQGLCKQVQEELSGTPIILLVAHFPTTFARLKQECDRSKRPYLVQERRLSPAEFIRTVARANTTPVTLIQADMLNPDEFPTPGATDLPSVAIVVAERHFLREHDDAIVNFAISLGPRCRVHFHLCLQDPLIQEFCGEWLKGILTMLGMQDSHPIHGKASARRIRDAQAKFAKQVVGEKKADSAWEWLKLNVPDKL
jgi:preprotein translocase subunit SecA